MSAAQVPIRRRLTAMVMLTSALVLVISSGATFAYQFITSRQSAATHLEVVGNVIAANSTAALAFQNPDDARSILAALRAEPQVLVAALYDVNGRVFAWHPGDFPAGELPQVVEGAGFRFEGPWLHGFVPVAEGGQTMGDLYLRADMGAVNQQLWLHGAIALAVALAAASVAFVASRRLQRQITGPIHALTETARAVSDRQDYSVRATPAEGYELALLTSTFNDMLARIQGQHARLDSQLARLHLLEQITRAISERHDLPSLFRVVLANLEDNLPIDFGCLGLCDETGQILTITSVGPRSDTLPRGPEQGPGKVPGLAEGAMVHLADQGLARCLTGELIHEPDTATGQAPFCRQFNAAGLGSLVVAPLRVEGRVFGALITARLEAHAFDSSDCEFLRQLTEHVSLAAHQTRLHSALKKAYDELRQTQQTVLQQERLRALGQMASGIAHDINNAISPVALYTEALLENEPDLSPRTRDYLTTIHRAIGDVAATVGRMREFYRVQEPTMVLAPVSINRMVEHVVGLTRARWNDLPQQRGVVIQLRTELAPDLPEILASESDIRDALTNLVFNAVDAMPDGGTLTIRTSLTGSSVSAQSHAGSYVCVDVSDTGVGMDVETQRRCLEPFFTTKGERGTGLGLAMVYGMAQRQGAELKIQSEPGYGTTVRLAFPASRSLSKDTRAQPEPGETPPPGLRVLLVDDDALVIKALRHTLEADGHQVTTASGGQAGIDAFNGAMAGDEPGFDVVITDLGMPYVDGMKVAAAVKAASGTTPVVLLTGWGQRLIGDNEETPHVDHVLSKPPRLQDLRAVLRKLGHQTA
jgi:signal transduction histidine kinase/CheY-like chemotaxis protein